MENNYVETKNAHYCALLVKKQLKRMTLQIKRQVFAGQEQAITTKKYLTLLSNTVIQENILSTRDTNFSISNKLKVNL